MISPHMRERVLKLKAAGKGIRQIARSLELSRNTIRTIFRGEEVPEEKKSATRPSFLDPYKKDIEELLQEDEQVRKKRPSTKPLTNKRIFKEIRKRGYKGGRTILDDYLRKLRGRRRRTRKAFCRFETCPAQEAQQDWSPYRVEIAGKEVTIHVFSLILGWSRYQFLKAYLDEKRPTLMWGHVDAFRYFSGVPWKIVYDEQKAITPCRIEGKSLINDDFAHFAEHYGFDVFICDPGDKERKGKCERPFHYFEISFLPCRSFESLEDLNQQLRDWLDGVDDPEEGNHREHGTTGELPYQRWLEEREHLFELPRTDLVPRRVEERVVNHDCTVSVGGCLYTVPARLVEDGVRQVWVSIGDGDVLIYDRSGELVAQHKLSEDGQKLVIDEEHYKDIRRRRGAVRHSELERQFLARFPSASPFLEGLKRTMRSIAPIHLRELLALARRYRGEEVEAALGRALADGTTTAGYVRTILSQNHPTAHLGEIQIETPKGLKLGPVDPGSAEGYQSIFINTPREGEDDDRHSHS